MDQNTQKTPTDINSTQATIESARKRVNLTLSIATHTRIKVWCARKGVTMQVALEGMLDKAFSGAE
jgi:hypothetical protein